MNSIYKNIKSVLQELKPKYADVIISRFGIDTDSKTLEAIGKRYGITRERVRQIEEKALSILQNKRITDFLKNDFNLTKNFLEREGKVLPEYYLIENYGEGDKKAGALILLLHLNHDFYRHSGNKSIYPHWHISKIEQEKAISEILALEKELERNKELFNEKELFNLLSHPNFLKLSKRILKGPLGKYGLSHWSEISPHGMKDKAYLVLKKYNKPMHFRDITENIIKFYIGRKALEQTVHNELIKDSRFILVGRGIYALNSWGYEPGNVKTVIAKVLKNSKKPLSKEEIINDVLKNRFVKASTIILNLNNNREFVKMKDGKYELNPKVKSL